LSEAVWGSEADPGMARPPGLCLLALLGLGLRAGGSSACWDPRGQPRRCMPVFENAAFGRTVRATNTCGSPPEDYCLQMGARHASALCHRCDASDPRRHHNASFLTDFHSQEESTWWQSQGHSMVGLSAGKAYEITYVRLKFHTSRPESFAIYKRSRAQGPWVPFQFYSASCLKTYGRQPRQFLRPGEDEQVAFCSDEFSDISPLSGGNVAFSTLEGRPSAYNFDGSPALQEWVTVTDLLISLNRLNTFGDDIFKDPKVLQSYYYAISDFSVGGRCKCNGHASECAPDEAGQLVCVCQHHTAGIDCERCQPFYQDRPWARGTAEAANECLPCNCSGRSEECFYDRELFRRSGHGGHCRNCRDNTAGPHCESCRQNYYRWEPQGACQPCHCHPAGAVGTCDPNTGHCTCKERVEGHLCNSCFCYGHSSACRAAEGFEETQIRSDFSQGTAPSPGRNGGHSSASSTQKKFGKDVDLSLFGAERPPLELTGGDGCSGRSLACPYFSVKPLFLSPAPWGQALSVSPCHPFMPICSWGCAWFREGNGVRHGHSTTPGTAGTLKISPER
uniref:Laminin subunit gamma 3 n=1 Tax=Malurus cyaneus samueli TaxID=2593467 RepID=A0A8C5UC49_9PASS